MLNLTWNKVNKCCIKLFMLINVVNNVNKLSLIVKCFQYFYIYICNRVWNVPLSWKAFNFNFELYFFFLIPLFHDLWHCWKRHTCKILNVLLKKKSYMKQCFMLWKTCILHCGHVSHFVIRYRAFNSHAGTQSSSFTVSHMLCIGNLFTTEIYARLV